MDRLPISDACRPLGCPKMAIREAIAGRRRGSLHRGATFDHGTPRRRSRERPGDPGPLVRQQDHGKWGVVGEGSVSAQSTHSSAPRRTVAKGGAPGAIRRP